MVIRIDLERAEALVERAAFLDDVLPLYSNQHMSQVWELRELVPGLLLRITDLTRERDELLGLGGMQQTYEATLRADAAEAQLAACRRERDVSESNQHSSPVSVHETALPIHLTERDRWLSECSCGWEQITRTEIEARLAWKNHKSAMDEQEEKARLTPSNERLRNEARDPDVASIEEAFLYVAPVHQSVVRDAQAALRRIVEEIDKWHREALDWQQRSEEGNKQDG